MPSLLHPLRLLRLLRLNPLSFKRSLHWNLKKMMMSIT